MDTWKQQQESETFFSFLLSFFFLAGWRLKIYIKKWERIRMLVGEDNGKTKVMKWSKEERRGRQVSCWLMESGSWSVSGCLLSFLTSSQSYYKQNQINAKYLCILCPFNSQTGFWILFIFYHLREDSRFTDSISWIFIHMVF